MQGLKSCTRLLPVAIQSVKKQTLLSDINRVCSLMAQTNIHTSSAFNGYDGKESHWLQYNKKIFPVQSMDEERRPAYVCHVKENIKYSPKNMWYVACLVRGMSVDEAVKQLSFVLKKGAAAAKETILEAQRLAVEKHNVEYKSNLWVAESFVGKGRVIKGYRRHARARMGEVRYTYCHYFVRLEEGPPPKNYYLPAPESGDELLAKWLTQMRQRKITSTL